MNSPTARNATSFTSDSKAIAATMPSWRSVASRWRVPNRIVNIARTRAIQNAGSLPIGTEVEISGASQPGEMVYNSWLEMQRVGEQDPNACAYNDFALIKIHEDDHDKVNPSIPFWGGPTGVGGATGTLDRVYSYGNSSLRLGITLLSPKTGVSLGTNGGGWNHPVYTVTPGIPGDSGSAFLDGEGRAIGVLSTLALAPLAGSNGVSDVGLALDYANTVGGMGVELVNGTEPFAPIL